MKSVPAFLIVLLLIWGLLRPGYAGEDVRFARINLQEELPGATVNCFAQDQGGLIWFGTSEGLLRFDGYDFELAPGSGEVAAVRKSAVTALVIDGEGCLWIGGDQDFVSRFDPATRELLRFPLLPQNSQSAQQPTLLSLHLDVNGNVLARLRGGRWAELNRRGHAFHMVEGDPFAPFDALRYTAIPSLEQSDGSMWLCLPGIVNLRVDRADGRILERNDAPPPRDAAYTWGDSWVTRGPDGTFWINIWGVGFFRYDQSGGNLLPVDLNLDERSGGNMSIEGDVWDGHGILWLASSGGDLVSFDPATALSRPYSLGNDKPVNSILTLFVDKSNVLWVATESAIYTLAEPVYNIEFMPLPSEGGETGPMNVEGFSENDADGGLYIASLGGLFSFDGREVAKEPVRVEGHEAETGDQILSVLHTSLDDLFVGTSDRGLLLSRSGGDRFVGMSGRAQISALLEDNNGRIWVATYVNGFGQLDRENRAIRYWDIDLPDNERLTSLDATSLLQDESGSIWVGTDGTGLFRVIENGTAFINYRTSTSTLVDDSVLALHQSADGTLWIGTAHGLGSLPAGADQFRQHTVADGLPGNTVYAVLTDDSGALWLTSPKGLHRYDPAYGVSIRFESPESGVAGAFTAGAACKSSDGSLYFGAERGFYRIRRDERIQLASSGPPVTITGLSVLGREDVRHGGWSRQGTVVLDYEENTFAIEFVVAAFADPEKNCYRYFLEGYDTGWSAGTGKAVASYTRIPPGRYTFRYAGADISGRWSAEKTLTVRIIPRFWMTLEFRIFAVMLVIAAIFGVHKLRTSAIKQQRRQLQREVDERRIAEAQLLAYQSRLRSLAAELTIAEEKERRRIADILHDKIGQALMMGKAKLDKYALEQHGELGSDLSKTREMVREAIKETRSLTVEVSPPSLHKFGIEAAIESLVEKLSAEHGIEMVMERGEKSDISKDASILIYQSARELLFNIIKHARASRVRVNVGNDGENFRLLIQDNGMGFNVEETMKRAESAGGYGLFSIQERMENIGGKMVITSEEGGGTEVVLLFPLHADKRFKL